MAAMITPGPSLTDAAPSDATFDARAATALTTLAHDLARTACIARVLLEHGRSVDLAGLDNGAGLLCAKALDLPPDLGRAAVADLLTVWKEIDSLTAALRGAAPA